MADELAQDAAVGTRPPRAGEVVPTTDLEAGPLAPAEERPSVPVPARVRTRLARLAPSRGGDRPDPALDPLFRLVRTTHPRADLPRSGRRSRKGCASLSAGGPTE